MNTSLNRWLFKEAYIGCSLPRFSSWYTKHVSILTSNHSESIDHHLALHALHRVHHHRHRARVQLLEALLRVDVHARQPAPEPRVAVVPPHDVLGLTDALLLLQELDHELIGRSAGIDAGFCAFDWKRKPVML